MAEWQTAVSSGNAVMLSELVCASAPSPDQALALVRGCVEFLEKKAASAGDTDVLYLQAAAAIYPDLYEFSEVLLPRGVAQEAGFEAFDAAELPSTKDGACVDDSDVDSEDGRAEARKRKRQAKAKAAGKKQKEETERNIDAIFPRLKEVMHVEPAGAGGSGEVMSETERVASESLVQARLAKATAEAKMAAVDAKLKDTELRDRAYEVYKKLRYNLETEKAQTMPDEGCIEILERHLSDAFDALKDMPS